MQSLDTKKSNISVQPDFESLTSSHDKLQDIIVNSEKELNTENIETEQPSFNPAALTNQGDPYMAMFTDFFDNTILWTGKSYTYGSPLSW